MATETRFRPFEEEILNEIAEALMDISKPNNNPSYLQGVRESKEEEEEEKGVGETSRSTALPENGANNKRKRDNFYANENSSAKRDQSDADLHPAQPKFNKIEFTEGKLIFRRVGQCSASSSSSPSTMERTPFKPNLDSNISD